VEVVASLSQGRRATAQCGLFTHKSVPVIFEPPCINSGFSTVKMAALNASPPPTTATAMGRSALTSFC